MGVYGRYLNIAVSARLQFALEAPTVLNSAACVVEDERCRELKDQLCATGYRKGQNMFHDKWSPAVEEYFRSIEQPFHETRRALKEEERTGFVKGFTIFAFVFSLLPLLPYILSILAPRILGAIYLPIWPHRIPVDSFWIWWPTAIAFSLTCLILSFKLGRPSDEERSKRLSPGQMRFAICYALLEEIKKYRRNHLQQHIDNAIVYLGELKHAIADLASLPHPYLYIHGVPASMMDLRISETYEAMSGGAIEGMGGQFGRPPRWFRFEPQTQRNLEALSRFSFKFRSRLLDKKDLAALTDTLSDLALYLYSEIAEVGDESTEERKGIEAIGDAALASFAQQILDMPYYRAELKPETAKEGAFRRLAAAGRKVSDFLIHQNVVVCFVSRLS